MRKEIPDFEGREVQAAVARFSGRTAQRVGAYAEGEMAYVIAKARIGKISHADFKAQTGNNSPKMYTRIHELQVTRAVLLPEKEGDKLFADAITAADEQYGIKNLFNQGDDADEEFDDTTVDESRNV